MESPERTQPATHYSLQTASSVPAVAMRDRGRDEVGLVEGAGGVASPLGAGPDADTAALARTLRADAVVLVAPAGLGTLSSVRQALVWLAPLPVVVFLNRYEASDRTHATNHAWLAEHVPAPVHTDPAALAAALTAGLAEAPAERPNAEAPRSAR